MSDIDDYRDSIAELLYAHRREKGYRAECSQSEELAGAAAVAACQPDFKPLWDRLSDLEEIVPDLLNRIEELESQARLR